MKKTILVTLLFAVGCGSSPTPQQPTACDPASQRVGTYQAVFTQTSGNCGPVADQLVILGPNGPGGDGSCQVTSAAWSDGNCRLDVSQTCIGGETITSYSVQTTSDGSELQGVESIYTPQCAGEYSVTLTRQ